MEQEGVTLADRRPRRIARRGGVGHREMIDAGRHRELAVATGIDHLAMADPPAASDPSWPAISERYTLLLHDYLGQLSEPLDERSIQRAPPPPDRNRPPWAPGPF